MSLSGDTPEYCSCNSVRVGNDPDVAEDSGPVYFCNEKYGMHSHVAVRTGIFFVFAELPVSSFTCSIPGSMVLTFEPFEVGIDLMEYFFTSDNSLLSPLLSASDSPPMRPTSFCDCVSTYHDMMPTGISYR